MTILTESEYFKQFSGIEPGDEYIVHLVVTSQIRYRGAYIHIHERRDGDDVWVTYVLGCPGSGVDADRDIARMKALEAYDDQIKRGKIG